MLYQHGLSASLSVGVTGSPPPSDDVTTTSLFPDATVQNFQAQCKFETFFVVLLKIRCTRGCHLFLPAVVMMELVKRVVGRML